MRSGYFIFIDKVADPTYILILYHISTYPASRISLNLTNLRKILSVLAPLKKLFQTKVQCVKNYYQYNRDIIVFDGVIWQVLYQPYCLDAINLYINPLWYFSRTVKMMKKM